MARRTPPLSWIVAGDALAFGLALIPAGRVGDRLGRKWVFVAGLALFTVASLACGPAQDDFQLIAARAVQGLAGGIFFTTITALIQLMFAPRQPGRAFAILGATIGFSTAMGPLAGGLIIQAFGAESGWRLVFGVNIPIGILPSPPRRFRHPSFTGGVVLALVYFAAFTSIFFTIALLSQGGLGHTALQSGLVAMPFAIGSIFGASQSDTWPCASAAMYWSSASAWLPSVSPRSGWCLRCACPPNTTAKLMASLLVAGIGSGLFIAPNAAFIVATVERADAGAASGVVGTARRLPWVSARS